MGIKDLVDKRIGNDSVKRVGCGDFDAYEVIEKIGVGGSGTVWKVRIGRELYAMKIPNSGNDPLDDAHGTICPDSEAHDSFLEEARNWAELTDSVPEAVVCLMDFNVEPFTWMVMELADGDLDGALKNGEFDREMFVTLLRTLQKIHNLGVIHRDIKPENILSVNGKWKFSDFGLSKLKSTKTMTGTMKGSPIYMAPEQIDHVRFGQTDVTTDLWQMGILLYRLVMGRNPYGESGDNLIAFVNAVCYQGGPDLSEVPPEWLPVFRRAFKTEHSERYQSAEEFADAVESVGTYGPEEDIPDECDENTASTNDASEVSDDDYTEESIESY